jgi:hypothetical protein
MESSSLIVLLFFICISAEFFIEGGLNNKLSNKLYLLIVLVVVYCLVSFRILTFEIQKIYDVINSKLRNEKEKYDSSQQSTNCSNLEA